MCQSHDWNWFRGTSSDIDCPNRWFLDWATYLSAVANMAIFEAVKLCYEQTSE